MSDPVYATVLILHVLAGVIGFGAIGVTGAYAAAARKATDPRSSASLRRYFRPGKNLAARAVFLVPILGGTLLGLGNGVDVSSAWPWIGLSLWTVALGVATAGLWPAERTIQQAFAAEATTEVDDGQLAAALRRAESAAALISCCFVAALVVMIAQPV